MRIVEIGIDNIQDIYLRVQGDELRIDDESNNGVIECDIRNVRKAIRIIEDVYKNHNDLPRPVYSCGRGAVQLSTYQDMIGKEVLRSNYIIISHMPTIISMLKSVKIEKDKYILNKDSLLGLGINDLIYLEQTMRRRKKLLTDNNGHKYIEV